MDKQGKSTSRREMVCDWNSLEFGRDMENGVMINTIASLWLYQKHYPPSLSDSVWRLANIGKDGAFHKRLSKKNINMVKDFLVLLNINPQKLKDADAHKLVVSAFEHWNEVRTVDDSCKFGHSS
ncbi:hypothetical protein ACSBR2_004777 [Camellia fascicularis]